jgi:glycosyltransferase involved in cell wall biosynthesis
MKYFFSFIIPTLNEEKFLPRLLSDLKNQKEKNFEVIIVDGASVDKTKEIAEKNWGMSINFFEVEKSNVSFQRNFGAEKAGGEYLIFLDADCRIYKKFTQKLEKIINKKKGLIFIPSLTPEKKSPQIDLIFKLINFVIDISQSLPKAFSAGGSLIIDKNFFKKIGGFDEKAYLAEDHNLIYKASLWGVRARFLPQIKVKVSLRRLKKEGELKLIYKYLYAAVYFLAKGKVNRKIFSYSMGGQEYENIKDVSLSGNLQKYLRKIKSFFIKYLT